MKTYGNLFDKIIDINNIRLAHMNARKDKTFYGAVKNVDENMDVMLKQIQEMLREGRYEIKSSDNGAYGTDVDCYLGYNYSSLRRTGDFKVASNGSNIKTQALGAWGGSSGTLTEYQEITEEGYTLTFNGGTLSGTWNSTEANAIHTIFTSSTATFGISKNNTNGHTATITVTYAPN